VKRDLWKRVLPAPSKAGALTLGALLALQPLVGTVQADSNGNLIVAPVKNVDINWIQKNGNDTGKASVVVSGSTLTIDLSQHPSLQMNANLTMTAVSKSAAVASASVVGSLLNVNVIAAGVGLVEIRAEQDGVVSVIDTLQFNISRLGDTNGDGMITSADALYITKLVNDGTVPTEEELNRLDINRNGQLDKGDASTLLSKYVGKGGSAASSYVVNMKEVNDAPVTYHTQITGTPAVGQTLTGSYSYYDVEGDAEGASQLQWYRGKLADGSDQVAIDGATSSSYTVQSDDESYYLFFKVVPSASSGVASGNASMGSTALPVPDTKPPAIVSLVPVSGSTATIAAVSAPFQIVFNEPVKAGSGKITLHQGATEVDCTATFSGNTVNIDHPPLDDVTNYYITVQPGAIQDLAGNDFAGLSGTTAWSFTTPDKTPPVVSTLSPVNGDLHMRSETDFILNFNENVVAVNGKKVSIYKADQTLAASYDTTDTQHISIASSSVTLKHALLDESQSYYVTVDPGAFTDASGNPFAGFTSPADWAVTVPDITKPAITSTVPVHQAVDVSPTGDLSISFSEAVVPVSGQTITIYDAATNVAAAVYAVDNSGQVEVNGQVVTLKHLNLLNNASYYVDIPAGAFKDLAGNAAPALSGIANWSFSTPDTIVPSLASLSPLTNGTIASKSTDLTMTFSENVTAVAGKKIELYKVTGSTTVLEATYDANDSANVTVNGKVVTIRHSDLEENTIYEVKVEPGAFEDKSHNPFEGLTQSTDWTFAVPDVTAPTATAFLPMNGATDVSLSDDFTLTFSENVAAAPNKMIYIRKHADQSSVAAYNANDSIHVTVNGSTVTIHNPGLQDENKYDIEVENGAFVDGSGNPFAGLSGSTGWSFNTPDTNPPAIIQTSPVNNAAAVSSQSDWTVTFHEPVSLVSGKHITISKITDSGSSQVASYLVEDAAHIQVNGAAVTIKHDELEPNTKYAVDIEAGAFTDSVGNPFAGLIGSSSWTFTANMNRTIAVANTEPGPLTEKQLNMDKGAYLDITITGDKFAEALGPADFQLNNAPAGVTILDATWLSETEVYLALDYDGTDMDANVDNFNVTVKATALESNSALTSDNLPITATVETEAPVFLSEYLNGGGSQVGIEIYNTGAADSGYTLKVYQFDSGAIQVTTSSLDNGNQPFVFDTNVPALAIDPTFYELQDVSNKYYYMGKNDGDPDAVAYFNFEVPIKPGAPITAIELINKNGIVVDRIGDPSSSSTNPVLAAGNTMRRKAAIHLSSSMYKPMQWDYYSKTDLINEKFYQGLARHTVTP